MPERNANLLLADTAKPAAGLHRANVLNWYGGPLSLNALGAFDGATVDIVMVTRMPAGGKRELFADETEFPDADFITLHTFTEPDTFSLDNLNPCALFVRVNGGGNDTRVRVNVA